MSDPKVQFNSSTSKVAFDEATGKVITTFQLECDCVLEDHYPDCFAADQTPDSVICVISGVNSCVVPTWANNTLYANMFDNTATTRSGDGVDNSGTEYNCIKTHTSGASTAWVVSTAYVVDDRRFRGSRNNNTYICITAHTSTSADEPGIGANWEDFWELDNDEPGTGNNWTAYWRTGYHPWDGIYCLDFFDDVLGGFYTTTINPPDGLQNYFIAFDPDGVRSQVIRGVSVSDNAFLVLPGDYTQCDFSISNNLTSGNCGQTTVDGYDGTMTITDPCA